MSSGTTTSATIATENDTGRATSVTAATVARVRDSPGPASARWRRMFSATTIDASTTIPTENASPPRLIRFDDSPAHPIRTNEIRNDTGSDTSTTAAVRVSARKRKSTTTTSSPPCQSASTTVLMHARISSVRS